MNIPKRHAFIPDAQVRPGVPTDHIAWVAEALVEYKPTSIINAGDWWDMPSLSSWDKPGSANMEGTRYWKDIEAGCSAMQTLMAPTLHEIKRTRNHKTPWKPTRDFLFGNHENRIDRAIAAEPKFAGTLGLRHCQTDGWRRHDFLERLELDGVTYSHYFQSNNSPHAIGGSSDNMLNKIGTTHTQGHRQGFQYGCRVYPTGNTRHSLVAGSCYLHREEYRGAQGQRHWRGIIIKNEVRAGDYSLMPLTLDYLCRKYEGRSLFEYMRKKYKKDNWDHLK